MPLAAYCILIIGTGRVARTAGAVRTRVCRRRSDARQTCPVLRGIVAAARRTQQPDGVDVEHDDESRFRVGRRCASLGVQLTWRWISLSYVSRSVVSRGRVADRFSIRNTLQPCRQNYAIDLCQRQYPSASINRSSNRANLRYAGRAVVVRESVEVTMGESCTWWQVELPANMCLQLM